MLGAAGVYALVSFLSAQRARELGIRAALGASRDRLVRLVLFDGVRASAWGLLVGVGAGLALARVFASQLYGLSSVEPTTYLVVALGLIVVALLASLRPALLASRSDPALVLREE